MSFFSHAPSTYLFPAGEKEFVGVDSVGNGAANEGDPMEHERWFIRVFEDELAKHVENDSQHRERNQTGSNDCSG